MVPPSPNVATVDRGRFNSGAALSPLDGGPGTAVFRCSPGQPVDPARSEARCGGGPSCWSVPLAASARWCHRAMKPEEPFPISEARARAGRILHWDGRPSSQIRMEDVEDWAQEAYALYWRHWETTGRADGLVFKWRLIDAARRTNGVFLEGKPIKPRMAMFADLGVDELADQSRATMPDRRLELEDLISDVAKLHPSPYVKRMVRLLIDGHTLTEIAASLDVSQSCLSQILRKLRGRVGCIGLTPPRKEKRPRWRPREAPAMAA